MEALPMAATAVPIRRMPDNDDLYEIIDGIRTVKTVGFLASIVASTLGRRLQICGGSPNWVGDFGSDLQILRRRHARRPDISLVTFEQLAKITDLLSDPAEPELAPNLAIEVISPTNSSVAVEAKIMNYFAAGVEAVWVVHPTIQRIYIYDSAKDCTIVGIGATLDGGKVLPGFSIPVADDFNIPKLPS
jgi:Uma2 family endonuclease